LIVFQHHALSNDFAATPSAQLNLVQLIQDHLKEMFSIIYTPTEGEAIEEYSRLFRKPQGCFLNIEDITRVHEDLAQWGSPEDIDYIVVTGRPSYSSSELHI
jgi:malic enzyme